MVRTHLSNSMSIVSLLSQRYSKKTFRSSSLGRRRPPCSTQRRRNTPSLHRTCWFREPQTGSLRQLGRPVHPKGVPGRSDASSLERHSTISAGDGHGWGVGWSGRCRWCCLWCPPFYPFRVAKTKKVQKCILFGVIFVSKFARRFYVKILRDGKTCWTDANPKSSCHNSSKGPAV